jgi:hypothetical protein
MAQAQVWTLIGLLATALFTLLGQLRGVDRRISDLTTEMHRGFGELRGDIAVIKARIDRDGP